MKIVSLNTILLVIVKTYRILGVLLIGAAFSVLIINFYPQLWYNIDSQAIERETNLLMQDISAQEITIEYQNQEESEYQTAITLPPQDQSLPVQPQLIIDKIGVNGPIYIGGKGDEELEKGIWMPTEFGLPTENEPTVLAAHRFGYLHWTKDFRTKNSFYHLPKLEQGDTISVIYDQRKFNYRVTKKFEANNLQVINSDLVLYTCKFFRSSERIVIYADLIP